DEFLRPVLDGLREGGWLENTTVFLVSDHGENLYEKAGTYGKSHVYHTSSEVPFVLHVPGEDRGSKRPELTSLVDVAATLLAAAGVSVPGELSGRDLLSGPARGPDEWIFLQGWDVANSDSARAVLFGDGRKWIRDGSGQDELYDLPSDPRERRNLLPSSEVRGQGYGPRFESIIETLEQNPSQPLDPTELPESVARRLRALGYVK
ncbi:MAG: sulfatase-like hydrolase/transferase, partial [Myxococcota bacterium]